MNSKQPQIPTAQRRLTAFSLSEQKAPPAFTGDVWEFSLLYHLEATSGGGRVTASRGLNAVLNGLAHARN